MDHPHLHPGEEGEAAPVPPQRAFYAAAIESVLTGSITAWYGSCSATDRRAQHFHPAGGPHQVMHN